MPNQNNAKVRQVVHSQLRQNFAVDLILAKAASYWPNPRLRSQVSHVHRRTSRWLRADHGPTWTWCSRTPPSRAGRSRRKMAERLSTHCDVLLVLGSMPTSSELRTMCRRKLRSAPATVTRQNTRISVASRVAAIMRRLGWDGPKLIRLPGPEARGNSAAHQRL